jgi:protein-S-isoprenylcysteine O-methyltransferase Ste14
MLLCTREWVTAGFASGAESEAIERRTFVLLAGVILLLLFWQWRPLPSITWHVDSAGWTHAMYGLQALGWVLVLLSTFLINHFEPFGLQQVYLHWRRREPMPPTVRERGIPNALYGFVQRASENRAESTTLLLIPAEGLKCFSKSLGK